MPISASFKHPCLQSLPFQHGLSTPRADPAFPLLTASYGSQLTLDKARTSRLGLCMLLSFLHL